jgi:hypothetical protein
VASSVAPAAWPALDLPLGSISRTGAPEWLVDRCDNVNPGNVDRCRYGDLTAPRTAVVVGDSMATSWLPALRAVLDPREWSVQVLTRNQCPLPRLGFWRERPEERFSACDEHKDWAVDRVRDLRPDLVVASNSTTMLDHQTGQPSGAARFPAWRTGMTRTLEELVPHSGRVVLLSPPPRAGNLQSCVTRLSRPVDCTTPVPADWLDLRQAERAAAAAAGASTSTSRRCSAPTAAARPSSAARPSTPTGATSPRRTPAGSPRSSGDCSPWARGARCGGRLPAWTSTPDLSSPRPRRRPARPRRSTPRRRCPTTPDRCRSPTCCRRRRSSRALRSCRPRSPCREGTTIRTSERHP